MIVQKKMSIFSFRKCCLFKDQFNQLTFQHLHLLPNQRDLVVLLQRKIFRLFCMCIFRFESDLLNRWSIDCDLLDYQSIDCNLLNRQRIRQRILEIVKLLQD